MVDDRMMLGVPPTEDDASGGGGMVATAVTTADRLLERLSIRLAMEPNLVHGFRGPLSLVEKVGLIDEIQGDPSGSSLGCVDIKTEVLF